MTLGEQLKIFRKQAGLSQKQLAEQLHISRSTVAKWEADLGTPDVRNLHLLSGLLNIPIQDLLEAPQHPQNAAPSSRMSHDPASRSDTLIPRRSWYKSTPGRSSTHIARWKQRFLFLLAAYLLLSVSLMLMPISIAQVGLPDLTEQNIIAITVGGNRPKLSTLDPAMQAADPAILSASMTRMQTLLRTTAFYCRTVPLNPLQLASVNGAWILLETDTDCYRFGDYHGLFFVEINGARRYYKSPGPALNKEIRFIEHYLLQLEKDYYTGSDLS